MKYFVSIAASDSSTGAGIQQDNRTAESLGFYPLNAITAITSQSFEQVFEVFYIDDTALRSQLNSILKNFSPLNVCKIGVVVSSEQIDLLSEYLKEKIFTTIVVDPVFRSTSGWPFLDESLIPAFREKILPYVSFVTPNKQELEYLCHKKLTSFEEAVKEATKLHQHLGCGVYLKGGHFDVNCQQITEALIYNQKVKYIHKKREHFAYNHGTGCAFSTAFACLLSAYSNPLIAAQQATELVSKFYVQKNKIL